MTSRFINGATYAISTALGAAVPVTAATNAAPAVLTPAPTADDIIVLQSGWPSLNDNVFKAGAAGALLGSDTTDETEYPPGEGVGVYRVAEDFVGLSQVRDVDMGGGEQQYFQYQYVEDRGGRQRQAPTFKNAMAMTILLDYDPNLPWYEALKAADRSREPVVLRERLPGGDVIYYYGLLSFNDVPTKRLNENMQVAATFSLQSDPIRYAAA